MNTPLNQQDKDAILNKLAELAGAVTGQGMTKKASSTLSMDEKNIIVQQLFKDPSGRGLKRVAYAMTEPLRTKLDYVGIGRKLLETDLLPQGVVPAYDSDFPEVPGIKVAARGNPPTIESWSTRQETPTFELATLRSIKYAEIASRRFNALDRTKDKAAFELKIIEDDTIFAAMATAANQGAQNTNSSSYVSRAALANAFSQIEGNRLAVGNLLMHPTGFKGIRGSWTQSDLDQVNMQGLLETGWMASLWNSKIYVTDRLNQITSTQTGNSAGTNTIYVLSLPAQLGRFPIRYDVEIKPFDYPPERAVFFSVYEQVAVLFFNINALSTVSIV